MAYNTMTAADIRAAVRSITDLDTDDLPDSLLNLYIRDGYYRILDTEKRWPFWSIRLLLLHSLGFGRMRWSL